jgi:hypothetical protein
LACLFNYEFSGEMQHVSACAVIGSGNVRVDGFCESCRRAVVRVPGGPFSRLFPNDLWRIIPTLGPSRDQTAQANICRATGSISFASFYGNARTFTDLGGCK